MLLPGWSLVAGIAVSTLASQQLLFDVKFIKARLRGLNFQVSGFKLKPFRWGAGRANSGRHRELLLCVTILLGATPTLVLGSGQGQHRWLCEAALSSLGVSLLPCVFLPLIWVT